MDPPVTPEPQRLLVRLGGWLFKHRTWIPLPLVLALVFVHYGQTPPSTALGAFGAGLIMTGELLRLWAVRHIGVISRTRSDRLGRLVSSGPFASVRNPLYLGNIAIWAGFALMARLVWMAPLIIVLLGVEYDAIVRWEEQLLRVRRGREYETYAASVPRWLPTVPATRRPSEHKLFSWRETLFSERGTLIAIAVGVLLLWVKQ